MRVQSGTRFVDMRVTHGGNAHVQSKNMASGRSPYQDGRAVR